jgi:hypothetical protein
VNFLIDWEGPSGPQNLRWVPPGHKVVREHPATDQAFWRERAASEFIKTVRCRYLRVQSEEDHVQVLGKNQHAIEMLNNATHGQCPWTRSNDNLPNILYDAHRPPNFVSTGQRYLTLAQTFKLLATPLKSHAERGVLPPTLPTDMTYGPMFVGRIGNPSHNGVWSQIVHADEAEIGGQAVIAAAARLAFGPERQPGSSEPPSNRVPLNVTADGKTMQAAQFLRLMAETYQALRAGKAVGVLRVRPCNILPTLALPWQQAHRFYEDTPAAYGFLQLWTVKPAQFIEAMKR